jgi:hypothetical protein
MGCGGNAHSGVVEITHDCHPKASRFRQKPSGRIAPLAAMGGKKYATIKTVFTNLSHHRIAIINLVLLRRLYGRRLMLVVILNMA